MTAVRLSEGWLKKGNHRIFIYFRAYFGKNEGGRPGLFRGERMRELISGGGPALWLTLGLVTAVILVNGGTDAPNAIATCVGSGALGLRPALLLAAGMNFLGVWTAARGQARVAATLCHMADFGPDPARGLLGLCAALTAIVIWAVAAWYFGIPTSESHALMAGLAGAALGMPGAAGKLQPGAWQWILGGLGLSAVLGFGLGFWLTRGFSALSRGRRTAAFFRRGQVGGAAAMAFCHGAQDGQKFMGVFWLGAALARGKTGGMPAAMPFGLTVYCALCMALGTALGGRRIIRAVGQDMTPLSPLQGFAADVAGAVCLLLSTAGGLPVSTTHTKTTAVMGAGAAGGWHSVDWGLAREMVLAWVLTFPGCGMIGFGLVKLLVK